MSEFRAFLVKSNALALALAVILGLALAPVVNSLVNDIIMPPIGLALGHVDCQNMFINHRGVRGLHDRPPCASEDQGVPVLPQGRSHPRGDALPALHERSAERGGRGLSAS